jgi:hypothetical protein
LCLSVPPSPLFDLLSGTSVVWASPANGRARCRAVHRATLRKSRPIRASIVPSRRSADAFGPAAPGLRAALAWGRRQRCGHCLSIRLSLTPSPCRDCSARLCAIKARRAVSSAAPAGRTHPALASLTAPIRALLTVAGDELRKDGGNEAGPGLRADPTGRAESGLRI